MTVFFRIPDPFYLFFILIFLNQKTNQPPYRNTQYVLREQTPESTCIKTCFALLPGSVGYSNANLGDLAIGRNGERRIFCRRLRGPAKASH